MSRATTFDFSRPSGVRRRAVAGPLASWLAGGSGLLLIVGAFVPAATEGLINGGSANAFELGPNGGFSAAGLLAVLIGLLMAIFGWALTRGPNAKVRVGIVMTALSVASAVVTISLYHSVRAMIGLGGKLTGVGPAFWFLSAGTILAVAAGVDSLTQAADASSEESPT